MSAPERALSEPGETPMARRSYPCAPCPIRADNVDNPDAKLPAQQWNDLRGTVRDPVTGEQPQLGAPMFGCHKGAPGTDGDLACAGWLARFGMDHITVRIAIASGRLPHQALHPGADWPPLHETWDEVVRAQTAQEPSHDGGGMSAG